MSDLHMEFAENSRYIKHNEFPVTAEVLVLAGEMGRILTRVKKRLTAILNYG